jgi:hypothetical protein
MLVEFRAPGAPPDLAHLRHLQQQALGEHADAVRLGE